MVWAWLFDQTEYNINSCFSYEDKTYKKWTKSVGDVAQQNLDKPLIVRDPQTLLIKVNFDPEVG